VLGVYSVPAAFDRVLADFADERALLAALRMILEVARSQLPEDEDFLFIAELADLSGALAGACAPFLLLALRTCLDEQTANAQTEWKERRVAQWHHHLVAVAPPRAGKRCNWRWHCSRGSSRGSLQPRKISSLWPAARKKRRARSSAIRPPRSPG
jgi:hypothetical protein